MSTTIIHQLFHAGFFIMDVSQGVIEICFMIDFQQNKDRETEKTIASPRKDC